MTEFALTLTMGSDWHVGAGAGRVGLVDRVIRRDHDDLPYLPAKTVNGVLRDAAEVAAEALDHGEQVSNRASWADWVDVVFGTQTGVYVGGPRPAALAVSSGHLGRAIKQLAKDRPALRASFVAHRPGVKISRVTGAAEDRHFRQIEFGRVGLSFASDLSLDDDGWTDAQRESALALLSVAIRLADRLGGNRRRGGGRVAMTSSGLSVGAYKHALRSLPAAPPSPPRTVLDGLSVAAATGTVRRWSVIVELREPVCVPSHTVGNIVVSHRFLPGSVLLPAVAARLRPKGGPNEIDRLIVSGRFLVSDGTFMIGDRRGYPVPATFAAPRRAIGDDVPATNGAAGTQTDGEPATTMRDCYIAGSADAAQYEPVSLIETTHNVIDDRTQRPTSDLGGVYTYEAIPAGRRLAFEITSVGATDEVVSRVATLGGGLRLGQSKKSEYGLVDLISVDEIVAGAEGEDLVARAGSTVSLWLLSDALLRDRWNRPTSTLPALVAAVQARLTEHGATAVLEAVGGSDDDGAPITAAMRTSRREGWHRGWQLPRSSLVGLAAGSVVRLSVASGEITKQAGEALQSFGIGERRAEGFGRVALNHEFVQARSVLLQRVLPRRATATDSVEMRSSERDLAKALARTALRRELWRAAREVTTPLSTHTKPTASQLGALRALIAQVRSVTDAGLVNRWLAHLEATPKRGALWPPETRKWLGSLVGEQGVAKTWGALELSAEHRLARITADPGIDEELTAELWPEAIRALIIEAIRRRRLGRDGSAH